MLLIEFKFGAQKVIKESYPTSTLTNLDKSCLMKELCCPRGLEIVPR